MYVMKSKYNDFCFSQSIKISLNWNVYVNGSYDYF